VLAPVPTVKLLMKTDEYNEIYNDPDTYDNITSVLNTYRKILFGWTDQEGTHFDILMVNTAPHFGTIQRGIRGGDLLVSIMSLGAFGFEINDRKMNGGYIAEKLNVRGNVTADALAVLICEVKKRLIT